MKARREATPEEQSAWRALLEGFGRESDRAAVILATARLDELLYQLISVVLLPSPTGEDPLLDPDRPLSTFSARINGAYRLGCIDASLARALHMIRRIRNAFAHETLDARLDSGTHRDRIAELIAPFRESVFFSAVRKVLAESYWSGKTNPALDFYTVVTIMMGSLSNAISEAVPIDASRAKSLVPREWVEYQASQKSRAVPSQSPDPPS